MLIDFHHSSQLCKDSRIYEKCDIKYVLSVSCFIVRKHKRAPFIPDYREIKAVFFLRFRYLMEACLFVFNSLSYFGTSNRKIQRYRVICELLYNVKKTIKKGSFLTLFAATGFKLTPPHVFPFFFFS